MSEKGMSLMPVLQSLCEWGMEHFDDEFELTQLQGILLEWQFKKVNY